MSEKVLDIIRAGQTHFPKAIYWDLFFTPDRMIAARASARFGAWSMMRAREREKKDLELVLEDILKAHKDNYAIPNSEITKVELKSMGRFHITTTKKKYKWTYAPEKKEGKVVKLKDHENILRPIFGDKLSVK